METRGVSGRRKRRPGVPLTPALPRIPRCLPPGSFRVVAYVPEPPRSQSPNGARRRELRTLFARTGLRTEAMVGV